ncbi:MAG: M23 family metallopeptidase [Rikenellaceae bacterium]|jgi:murein DD-endopeptidase MepM/ murein hydrolase activator NlpD|nr:M23 family metallopeptidase [Rikenellaceae bacterium]
MARRAKIKKELTPRRKFVRGLLRVLVQLLVWVGIAVTYYFVFSFFFDTTSELRLRTSSARLEHEYEALNARYDSLMAVLDNVAERDRNVFQVLFESDPYSFEDLVKDDEWKSYERLMDKSNRELATEFFDKLERYSGDVARLEHTHELVQARIQQLGEAADHIPSIQPVVNNDLTRLTASYGLLMHPFFRTLTPHKGVDYTVPEGTRVFATADGTVSEVTSRNTGSGLTVVINHGGGYETTYSHLSRATVRRGQKVSRGDIIARTGNTGLSLAPHLHYEVRKDGLRVDPIHYFFMELTPKDYQRIIRVSQSGMQSFD